MIHKTRLNNCVNVPTLMKSCSFKHVKKNYQILYPFTSTCIAIPITMHSCSNFQLEQFHKFSQLSPANIFFMIGLL